MTRVHRLLALIAVAYIVAPPALAAAADKSCSDPEYHAFDFWLGDWDTFDLATKGPAGGSPLRSIARNHVDSILDGCVIREDYDQFDGHHGQSFTIYDVARKVWHQSWVTNRGELLVLEGTRTGKRITLEGDSVSARGEQRIRASWEPQGDGVREIATVSDDSGKTWKPLFDIVFRRHPS
jgi:hypothetical protein